MLMTVAWWALQELIPLRLLDKVCEVFASNKTASQEAEGEAKRLLLVARRRLVGLGLFITNGKETVTLHRLVSAYIKNSWGR